VADRAYDAHQLRVTGQGWADIARAVGYISAQVAQMAVTAYLQKAAVAQASELRQAAFQTELDRLDLLHAAFWPLALQADAQAAAVILKIHDRRTRLLKLDEASDTVGQRTVLIHGGEHMARDLRAAALESQRDAVARGGDRRMLDLIERMPVSAVASEDQSEVSVMSQDMGDSSASGHG